MDMRAWFATGYKSADVQVSPVSPHGGRRVEKNGRDSVSPGQFGYKKAWILVGARMQSSRGITWPAVCRKSCRRMGQTELLCRWTNWGSNGGGKGWA